MSANRCYRRRQYTRARSPCVNHICTCLIFFRQTAGGKVPRTGLVLAHFFGTRLVYLSCLFVKPRREKFREGRFQTKSADFREQVWTQILCVLTRFIQVYAVAGDVNLQSIWRKTHFVVTVIVIVFFIIVFLFFFVATFSEFVLQKAKWENKFVRKICKYFLRWLIKLLYGNTRVFCIYGIRLKRLSVGKGELSVID